MYLYDACRQLLVPLIISGKIYLLQYCDNPNIIYIYIYIHCISSIAMFHCPTIMSSSIPLCNDYNYDYYYYIYIYVYVCMYIYTYICHLYIYIYIYICMYVYTYIPYFYVYIYMGTIYYIQKQGDDRGIIEDIYNIYIYIYI